MPLDEFWRNQLNRACYFCGHADAEHPYEPDPVQGLRGRCTKCKDCPAYHWDYVSALEQLMNELRSQFSEPGGNRAAEGAVVDSSRRLVLRRDSL